MLNTSLAEILRKFTPEAMKKFDDFVSSPYHNKKSAVTNLYKHIKKYAPEFQSPRLENEKVWNALYPDKEFNYGVFKNLIFDLTHLAEKFLAFEYYQNYDFQMKYDLLDSLNEMQFKNLFKSKFRATKDEMDETYNSKQVDASSYHYYMSKMYLLKFAFCDQFERNRGMIDDFANHSLFQASTILYSIFHTSMNALNISRDHIYNKDQNVLVSFVKKAESNNLISELIESIKPHSAEIYNILDAYHRYYKSVSDNTSIEKYHEFKRALLTNAPEFSKPDRYILYSGLRNALSKLISSEMNKSKEILEIVRLKIKDDVMLNQDGIVTESEFVACIQAACDTEDGDFINDFTERFLKYLPRNAMENMKKYSMAHLYFTKNEFEKSLETISTINFDLFIMKYYLKNLQMMNHYEMDEHNSFHLLLDSYKHFLHNNKSITEEWKKEQTLFNSFLCRLFKLKERFNEFESKSLKNEISVSLVHKKHWLLRKVNELEKSIKN